MQTITENQFTEQDRQSIALSNRAQERLLRDLSWGVDRILGSTTTSRGQSTSVPPQHYDVNLLETPWALDGRSETSEKTRIINRHGKLVALVACEDVSELLVSLINRTPTDQITTDL